MAVLSIESLQNYHRLGYNVLLEGEAGVGKTAAVNEVFKNVKWKYFSAATLDPWVDLIGVPRPVDDVLRGGQVLELVRPEFIKADDVEAIFLDELNRAPSKVLDAVMELIQFKSINGYKLKNLKVIWAAVNPADDDGEYTVSRLDKALRDRFHVQIQVPYKIDEVWFRSMYPTVADAFIGWWGDLPDTVKKQVSPRRVSYVADAYLNGCALADFLPPEANISKLVKAIRAAPFQEQLNSIQTELAAIEFLKQINNATKLLQLINSKDPVAIAFYKRYGGIMPRELVDALAPHVAAAEMGKRISTLGELLPLIKGKAGDVEITHMINEVAFAYTNGTLLDEVKRQIHVSGAAFRKVVGHLIQVMTKAPEPVLRKAMFMPDSTEKSNFTTLAMYIAAVDTTFSVFSKEDRKRINAHTYLLKCAASKWM